MTEPAYEIYLLGRTVAYDVYDVVIYPQLAEDREAQERYKREVLQNCDLAQAAGRKPWGAVDVSRLNFGQMLTVIYRVVLPFVRQPLIAKSYGVSVEPNEFAADRERLGLLGWIMQTSFRHAVVPDRAAALPPGFVAEEHEMVQMVGDQP